MNLFLIVKNQDLVESPLQRFKRLEIELSSLKNDLVEMDQFASEEDKKQLIDFDPINLSKQVEELQSKVKTLHLETIGAKVDINKLNNKAKKSDFESLPLNPAISSQVLMPRY